MCDKAKIKGDLIRDAKGIILNNTTTRIIFGSTKSQNVGKDIINKEVIYITLSYNFHLIITHN